MGSPKLTHANAGASITKTREFAKQARLLGVKPNRSFSTLIARQTGAPLWHHRKNAQGEHLRDLVSEGMFFMPSYDKAFEPKKFEPRLETISESTHIKQKHSVERRSSKHDELETELKAYAQPANDDPRLLTSSMAGKGKPRKAEPRKVKKPVRGGPLTSCPVTPTDVTEWASAKGIKGRKVSGDLSHSRSSSTSNLNGATRVDELYMQAKANQSAPHLTFTKLESTELVGSPPASPFECNQSTMNDWEALKGIGEHARSRRANTHESMVLVEECSRVQSMNTVTESPVVGTPEEKVSAVPKSNIRESINVEDVETIGVGKAMCREPVQGTLDGQLVNRVLKAFWILR